MQLRAFIVQSVLLIHFGNFSDIVILYVHRPLHSRIEPSLPKTSFCGSWEEGILTSTSLLRIYILCGCNLNWKQVTQLFHGWEGFILGLHYVPLLKIQIQTHNQSTNSPTVTEAVLYLRSSSCSNYYCYLFTSIQTPVLRLKLSRRHLQRSRTLCN